ncbi:hypothetical protein [Palaeococcus sp. (in: euryarchaeotes)]
MNGGFVIIAVAIGIPVFMMALIWYIKWKNLKKVEAISNGLKIVGDEIISAPENREGISQSKGELASRRKGL